ncbi:hypothetical protein C8R46DRAFT_1212475 [Mycena filopes]|nr:hypothetical protein C8R46DRAFT_1212475 [Mycena filopes]
MAPLPTQYWPLRLHTRLELSFVVAKSLSCPPNANVCVHIRGAGPNLVSLSLKGVGDGGRSTNLIEIPDVDTLLGKVHRPTSSWTFNSSAPRNTIKLCFPSCETLNAFLFALSYVRVSHSARNHTLSIIPFTERRLTQQDIDRFIHRRAIIYRRASIAVLPTEVLSEVFSFLPHSKDRGDSLQSPLLLLRVCSEWRSVAIGTPNLWRTPPTFTFRPSFFSRGGGDQILLWLDRAKGSKVALSIAVPHRLGPEIPHFLGSHPSPFTAVRSLRLVCPPSQLQPFLGPVGPAVSSLEALSLHIVYLPGSQSSQSSLELCRSAPLLRDAWVETRLQTRFRLLPAFPDHGLDLPALFPWPQLTRLTMRLRLEFSAWVHIITQCTSLEAGQFVLFDDHSPYPMRPVTLPWLDSLRLAFHHVHDIRFLNHLSLPSLSKFHVEGTLMGAANIDFVANYPALRDLTVHLDLLDNGLQEFLQRPLPLEKSSPVGFQATGVQRPRNFTILTFTRTRTHKFASKFVETSADWIVKWVLAGCDFDLYGESALLQNLRLVLASAAGLEASVSRTCASNDGLNAWARGNYLMRARKVPKP